MSSDATGSNGRSAIALVDESPGDRSEGALASATAAMVRAEHEINDLWRDSMAVGNRALSERLVEVSHALRRAASLLEPGGGIG